MVKDDVRKIGGTERSLLLAAHGLASAGHQTYLLHAGGTVDPARHFTASLSLPELFDRSHKLERPGVRRSYRELRRFLAEHEIDVAHVHGGLRTAILLRLQRHVAVVMTAHNTSCPNTMRYLWNEQRPCDREIGLACLTVGYRTLGCGHLGDGSPLRLRGFVRGMVEDRRVRSTIARSHRVIAPSEWMREYLTATGTPPERISVVTPPIVTLSAVGVPGASTEPLITFVGRLVPFKGAEHVLCASARLDVEHRVAIAGDGPMRSSLEDLAHALGIDHRVEFHGEVEPEEAEALRRRSAAVVVPSLAPETYGMVGPESIALGVPVVGYRVGGMPEWLDAPGGLSHGVEAGDIEGMARALSTALLRSPSVEARGAAAQLIRRTLSPTRHAARLIEVYADAIHLRSTGAERGAAPVIDLPGLPITPCKAPATLSHGHLDLSAPVPASFDPQRPPPMASR